jgi:hypothetical protein
MFRCQWWFTRAGIAFLLLASMGASSLGLHSAADRDVACNPIAIAHDSSAHYIGIDATPDAPGAEHCFLCHSLRSFHPAFDRFEQPHNAPRAERLQIAPLDRAGRLAWTIVPGRAPPV